MTLPIVIIVAILLYVIILYNGMVKLQNQIKEAWSDIDVQLKRRYNLIPNIVETVKGYAAHEEGVLVKVTEARANAINATNIHDQGAAENMLAGALKSLFAVTENYPDLKANENFMQLQNELVDTEDKIQAARRFYNGVARDFNTKIQQFPAKVVAQMFKFKNEDFFEIENEEEKEVVKVDFNKGDTMQADKEDDQPKKEEASPEASAPSEEVTAEAKADESAPVETAEEDEQKEEPKEEPKEEGGEEEKPKEEEPTAEEGHKEESAEGSDEEKKEEPASDEDKEKPAEQTKMPLGDDPKEESDEEPSSDSASAPTSAEATADKESTEASKKDA